MPRGVRETAYYVIHDNTDVLTFPAAPKFRAWVKHSKVRPHDDPKLAAKGYGQMPSGAMVLILKAKPIVLKATVQPVG